MTARRKLFIITFYLQGLVSIKLTTSAAFVTLVIPADTAIWLLPSVIMTLVILVFPAWIKQCQLLVVRVHLVLQATGRAAKVTTVRSSLNTLETLKLNGKLEGIRVEIFLTHACYRITCVVISF